MTIRIRRNSNSKTSRRSSSWRFPLLVTLLVEVLILLPLDLSPSSSSSSSSSQRNRGVFVFALLQSPTVSHRGSNRLFLDTADKADWQELLPLGIFHGVTTNPTLLEESQEACNTKHLHTLAQTALSTPGCHEFMCQAWGTTAPEMYKIGMELSKPDRSRIVVMVPVTKEGTKAAACLIQSGVRVCLTACYNSHQAIIAAGLGAEYIAPNLGGMSDNDKDGMEECLKMQEIVKGMGSSTRILVSSVRDVDSMAALMALGKMDTFAMNPEVARELFDESLTLDAADELEAAAQRGFR